MNCIQKQQLVSFPKVRIWKPWFRHFNNHKEFRNEGTVHLFSLMALFSYANFRSNERMISGARYMEAPGQWICKLGSLPRILRVHSKRQALEQLDYYEKYGFLTYEWLDKENEIIRFSIINWKEHCTSLQYNYYSYKGSGFFFFPLPVGRMLLRVAHKTEGIVFSELDAIMDMWLHTILNDPKVRGSEYMPGRVLLQYARCAVALIYLPSKTLGLVKITRWPLHVESWRIWNYQPCEFFKLTRLCHFNVSVSRNDFWRYLRRARAKQHW